MFYNVLKLDNIVNLDGAKFHRRTLLQNDNSDLSVVAIKKDEIMETHIAPSDAAVYVFEGEIDIHFDAEKFTVGKGEMILFKKNDQHSVVANKDSKFLVVKL